MKTTICCYNIMTIADINSLPVINLKVTGRVGSGTSVTVIDQESKGVTETTNFTYTQGESLEVTIEDQTFIDGLEESSTLSVILYKQNIPLYRDIIRFTGELNPSDNYTQYEASDELSAEYFIYGTKSSFNLISNSDFSSLGSNILTGFSPNNENSSVSVSSGVVTISGTSSPSGATFDGLSSLSGSKIYKLSLTASAVGSGGLLAAYRDEHLLTFLSGIGTTLTDIDFYLYALDGESLNIAFLLGSDLGDLTISDYSVKEVEDWSISGSEINSYIFFSGTQVVGDTSDYRSTVNLSTVTSISALEAGQDYILSGTSSNASNPFTFKQGSDTLGTVSSSGDFEFTFTSSSTDAISIEFGNAIDTFDFSNLKLLSSST